MDPRIQYAKTEDAVSIAFFSSGEGVPVIMTPPIPWSHLQIELDDPGFRPWFDRNARTKRIIRYDNRGSGLSDHHVPELSLEAFERDILAVADKLGLDKFVLAGISVGSPVAISFAANHPDRLSHLILWCGFASADAYRPQALAMRTLRDTDWGLFTETIAHATVAGWGSSDDARRFAQLMRGAIEPETLARGAYQVESFDFTDLLPGISCPVLVLHRKEAILPDMEGARRLAAALPDAQLVVLEGGSLLPWIGNMEDVAAAIDDFLGLSSATDAITTEPAPRVAATGSLVTILFTDLVGHTEMMSRLGDTRGRAVLREHERITREMLKANGGTEVKTMGDGFMASFGSVTKAVECAIALQLAFAERQGELLSVRVGLNAGEPIEEDGDLFGATVILASRIAAKAEGGEILVADTVRGLCSGKDFLFADRGEFVAKGFEEPVRFYEVSWRNDRRAGHPVRQDE